MELSKRILEILEKSGLTPSEFADKIEVQRSAISHITSGRNKPSLEFIIKIKNAFPEIDMDWLIFGYEKKIEEIQDESVQIPSSTYPTLFDFNESVKKEDPKPETSEDSLFSQITTNNSDKRIKKVILIYDDGTFDDFSQNKKLN